MTASATRLALRVRPATFEPGWALFNRLALRHGCETQLEFARQVPLVDRTDFVRDMERGRRFHDIARLSGVPLETLLRNSILQTEGGSVLAGELVSRSGNISYSCHFARICPDCMRSDIERGHGPVACRPWRRSWWDLAKVSSCPHHGRALLAICPACRHVFRRSDLSPARCTCGHDLTQEYTEAITSDGKIGDAYLVGRLGDGPRISHAFLDSLAFADAAEIMQWVGSVARWGRSIISWRRQEPAERARTMAAGFAVCEDFPNQFEKMLDGMLAACPLKRLTPVGVYGRLQYWLGLSTNPTLDPIREVVRNHVVKNVPITAGTMLFRQPATEGDLTTLGGLAKLCGVSAERVATVAAALRLIDSLPSNARGMVVPKSLEEPLTAFFRESCSPEDARRYLGVGLGLFKALIARHYLPRAFPLGGASIPAQYCLADLDRFLMALHGDAPFVTAPPPGSETILRAVRICYRSSEAIIGGLLRGQIRATGRLRGERGFAQILVDTDAVITGLEYEDDPMFMLMAQAARHLGVTIPTVAKLKQMGWLTIDRKQTPLRIMPALRRAEVEAFGARFVSAAELARIPGKATHAVRVHQHLRSAGLVPAIAGSRKLQPFYHRESAEKVIRGVYRDRLPETTAAM